MRRKGRRGKSLFRWRTPGGFFAEKGASTDRVPLARRMAPDVLVDMTAAGHFPGISRAAGELLVARRAAAVGIDTASIDHGPSLGELPPRGAVVIALPMTIRGGSGGPLRIVAWLP